MQGSHARLERVRIHFAWVLKLRWLAAAGQLATILFVSHGLGIALPELPLLGVVAFEGLTNAVLAGWARGVEGNRTGEAAAARIEAALVGVLLCDIVLLSLLLYLTGGPWNPFSVFYLVNFVLGAMVLPAVPTAVLVGLGLACHAALFFFHLPIPELTAPAAQGRLSLAHAGALVAFPAAAAVIAVFVTRLTGERAALERKLDEARRQRERFERLEALGTLAAGAAHELASPLSTIAVVARDLELELTRRDPDGPAAEDARLVRQEVQRCRHILEQMAADAGQIQGGDVGPATVDELVDAALGRLRRRDRVEVEIAADARRQPIVLPRRALPVALRQVVKNALDATHGEGTVRLRVDHEGEVLRIRVEDRGPGMDRETLERAAEPFFTTKEPGHGMGLGLFLAQTVVERLGGRLAIESREGSGTSVHISLPTKMLGGHLEISSPVR